MRSQEQNLRLSRARKVAIYVLRENVGLTTMAASEEVGRSSRGAYEVFRTFKESMRNNMMVSQEVTYLGKVKTIKQSIDQRIVSRVMEATGIEETALGEPAGSEELEARNMAIALMMERGYFSGIDVANYFSMTGYREVLRIAKSTALNETRNAHLAQKMNWVRRHLLSERPATFTYKPLDESQELPDSSESLPDIDKKLVDPKFVADVYGAIHASADYYNLPVKTLLTRSNKYFTVRARNAALIICDDMRIPYDELGLCFNGRSRDTVKASIKSARSRYAKDEFFFQELEDIVSNDRRKHIAIQTLLGVCAYYGVTHEDMRSGKQEDEVWQDRARSVYMTVMERKATIPRSEFAAIIDRAESFARATTASINRRMLKEPRLKAEVDYLYDPLKNSRPLPPKEMLTYVLQQMDLSIGEVQNPETEEQYRARRIAAFILSEETSLPERNIATLLGDEPENISKYIKKTRKNMIDNPRLALEIDSCLPANAVNRPLTGNILRLISKRYSYTLRDLREGDETDPRYAHVLGVVVKLMAGGPKHPLEAIADLLQKSNEEVAQLTA
jgi:hypothetical protein